MTTETDYLILGAGVTGLAAASLLDGQCVVLERNSRPGGLVRSERINGYWFDHVLHLLYFADSVTQKRIQNLMGDVLVPCPPQASVETKYGVTRYPLQMHLNGLRKNVAIRCVRDLAEATFSKPYPPPMTFESMLRAQFGQAMCDVFMFPYNRKLWKRPLSHLTNSDFTWNITQPDFERVLAGALSDESDFQAYNAEGWYPRPPLDSPVRGMEALTRSLAQCTHDLRLDHTVTSIDPEHRLVTAMHNGQEQRFRFQKACLCTLELVRALAMTLQTPPDLLEACRHLVHNRVLSAMFCIRGKRPDGRGHWRYYADESVAFNRLIYMHEFDPHTAPENGWGLMAEITEPAEYPPAPYGTVLARAKKDIQRVKALPPDCEIIDERLLLIDPAYVAFTLENQAVIQQGRSYLQDCGITPLGRYGRWEYSSMGQAMRDGFSWAEERRSEEIHSLPWIRPATTKQPLARTRSRCQH